MVGAGDELGRSQRGNNNAYCQDNEMSWIDWEDLDATLRVFTSRLFALRRRYAVLRSTRWANGEPRPADGVVDLAWFDLRGHAMGEGDWNDRGRHSVAFCLDGRSGHGTPTTSLYVIINGEGSRSLARVPEGLWPGSWQKVLDTADPVPGDRHRHLASGERIRLEARSLAVLAGAALWDG